MFNIVLHIAKNTYILQQSSFLDKKMNVKDIVSRLADEKITFIVKVFFLLLFFSLAELTLWLEDGIRLHK